MRAESEIRDKIKDSFSALQDFAKDPNVAPEQFFVVARQATYLTALYWVLEEPIPEEVTKLAVPIVKKMGEIQANAAKNPTPITVDEDEEKAKKGK